MNTLLEISIFGLNQASTIAVFVILWLLAAIGIGWASEYTKNAMTGKIMMWVAILMVAALAIIGIARYFSEPAM